jgi:Uma2 family endonuclease
MSIAAAPMTTDQFLALPDDDGVERWLIAGELRERPMSLRSPPHAAAITQLARHLGNWCAGISPPRPRVYTGDIYFRLRRNPDSNVGIDVGVATPEQVAATPANARLIDGPPLLAVEVLSATDTIEEVSEKTNEYLDSGTRVVWVVDPFAQTVTVFRPGTEPVLFSRSQTLQGDPELTDFAVTIADLFD